MQGRAVMGPATAMVFTVAVRHERVWTRRAVLVSTGGAGVAGVLAGCSWWEGDTPDPPPDPLAPMLAATRALLDRYERTIAAHPELADRLQPLARAHTEHVTALVDAIGDPELATPAAAPTAAATPAAVPEVAADPQEAVDALREDEQQARAEAAQQCLTAEVARVSMLGSICAARASHAEVLG